MCNCGTSNCNCGITIPQKGDKGDKGRGYDASSSTSLDISTGSKSFTMTVDKAYVKGSRVRMASDADPTVDWMEGIITGYNPTTGAATVLIDLIDAGTGTHTDWNISIAGEQGQQGVASQPVLLYSNPVAIGSPAASGTQTVDSYSMAAGLLATNGDFIEVEFAVRSNNGSTPVVITSSINSVAISGITFIPLGIIQSAIVKQKITRLDATNFSYSLTSSQAVGILSFSGLQYNVGLGANFSASLPIGILIQRPFGATALNEFYIEDISIKAYIQ